MKRLKAVLFCSLLVVKITWASEDGKFKENEYLIKFQDSVFNLKGIKESLFKDTGLKVKETISKRLNIYKVVSTSRLKLFRKTKEKNIQVAALNVLKSRPEIEMAEPNYIYSIDYKKFPREEIPKNYPNDPDFSKLWGLWNPSTGKPIGADIRAPQGWALATGSKKIVVAVVDTGVDYKHPDLKDNMWIKPGTEEAPIYGYDAITNKEDPMDDHGHGTHCAGTIGAVGNNKIGVVGVNWHVSLMAIRFMDKTGSGDLAGAVKGIEYAIENGAQVLSNSWGGGSESEILKTVIASARDKGILFIAAAGNQASNNDLTPSYPASYNLSNVVSVAATSPADLLAFFSNFGPNTVHIAAPGLNILSTTPKNSYAVYSGTSMATPHVAGAIALVMSKYENLSFGEIKQRLLDSADKLESLRLRVRSGARLNIYNLLADISPPGPVVPKEEDWSVPANLNISTPHPYAANYSQRWEISQPGAEFIRLKFSKFELEKNYDKVNVIDLESGEIIDVWHGERVPGIWSPALKSSRIALEFKSDHTVQKYGFDLESFQWAKTD